MAQVQNDFNVVQAPAGIFYPQDFSLQKLNLITSTGKPFELKKIIVEMSYYEDIYSFAVSGSVTVRDAQGFIELLQLSGNEFLEVNFGKIKNAPNNDDQIFRVYKIGRRSPSGNMNNEYYTLYFCSEELFLSEQIKVTKSFGRSKISDIVSNILTETLQVDPTKINVIENTTGVYNFIVPRLKPLETISWLSTYARPENGVGSDMLFFENRDGFNFRSLQSIYSDKVYATYNYQQKNLNINDATDPQQKATTVIDYEFIKTYDALGDTSSGTYANRLITIDPLTRYYKVTDFDYSEYQSEATSLNGQPVITPSANRLGITQNQAYDAVTKLLISNANQAQNQYIQNAPGSVAGDIFAETYIPNRTAQIALANYTLLKIMVPGDPGLSAGRVINFNLYSLKPTDKQKDADKFYSGKYLVVAVRHIIDDAGSYITVMEIAKESSPKTYSPVDSSSPNIMNAITQ